MLFNRLFQEMSGGIAHVINNALFKKGINMLVIFFIQASKLLP
jgi:hypothetical protein